jgi:methyl-accepting chemotaxis protein
MFSAFSNIPIFRRLAITFSFATLIPILVILLLGNFSLQSSETRSSAVHTSFAAQNLATEEQVNLQRMNALLQARFAQVFAQGSLSLEGDPSSGKLTENDVQVLETHFNQSLSTYKQKYELATSSNMSTIRSILLSDEPVQAQQVISKQQRALDLVINTAWPNYQNLLHKVLKDLGANTFYLTAYADFYQADLGFLELKNNWQDVVDTSSVIGTTVTQVGPSLTSPLIGYTIAALVFTLLVIVAAGFLINFTIISPLNQLVSLTRRVAEGEIRARANIRGRDEINQVASSMNGMLDNIVRLMQEAQNRHADLQAQIQKMIGEVSGVGEGNLRIHLQVTSSELGMLANSFNIMAQELNSLVVNVKILARGVQNATLQAFIYMEQLVENADSQIQNIVKATSEVSNVAETSHKMADRAQILYSVANDARQTAHRGRTAIQRTVRGMERINENVNSTSKKVVSLGEHSREINNVVEVIVGIAHQTNRLALDASVQAATAGEHGQGFAAVAADIRRLAERAKEQSSLISQIVRNVLEDISSASVSMRETARETAAGTQVTREVGNALELMFSAVEHQASEIEVTNQVATQQVQTSNSVVQIMQDVSDSTRQNSEITRHVTSQIERLAQLAGQLLASVEVFKLQEDQPARVVNGQVSSPRNNAARSISSPAQVGARPYGRTSPLGRPPAPGPDQVPPMSPRPAGARPRTSQPLDRRGSRDLLQGGNGQDNRNSNGWNQQDNRGSNGWNQQDNRGSNGQSHS